VANVSLQDIEEIARQESAKMQHFYIGVEHLFIALTMLDGGASADIFEQRELSAPYLCYITQDLTGHGEGMRYWTGYRYTPRAMSVLVRARELSDTVQPDERALLIAILEEGDNIPARALQEVGIDLPKLLDDARHWSGSQDVVKLPPVPLKRGEKLSDNEWAILQQMFQQGDDERQVLQQMFQKYAAIEIEHLFQGGFSGSVVMLVRPVQPDGRFDAEVVVKIDERQSILWEKKRYDSYVKDTLPMMAARIESDPVLPDRSPLGGLKYTFVRLPGDDAPINLRDYAEIHTAEDLARFLREALYEGFRATWWGQAQPYRFPVWREYDFMLPPALVIQALPDDTQPMLTHHLQPLEGWSRNSMLHPGDVVELNEFTVQKAKRADGILQLTAGAAPEAINRADRVEVQGLDFRVKTFYRGEVVKKITGRIVQTRDDILQKQVQALEPNFNILDDMLPFASNPGERLPNPLRRYRWVLEQHVSGTLSIIHGDLHTGNILIGPGGDAWLIDFEWTRDGHTLFDWATLETSLLIDYVMPFVGQSWDDAWKAIRLLDSLNRKGGRMDADTSPLTQAFAPIVAVRGIVTELLPARQDRSDETNVSSLSASQPKGFKTMNWSEYHIALALCALRVISWTNRPLIARRLAFLASALAMDAARVRDSSELHATAADFMDATTDPHS